MKKYLTFALVAIVAIMTSMAFTSCDKKSDKKNEPSTTVEKIAAPYTVVKFLNICGTQNVGDALVNLKDKLQETDNGYTLTKVVMNSVEDTEIAIVVKSKVATNVTVTFKNKAEAASAAPKKIMASTKFIDEIRGEMDAAYGAGSNDTWTKNKITYTLAEVGNDVVATATAK